MARRKVKSKPEPESLLFRESEPPIPGHREIIKPDPHPPSDEQEPVGNGIADQDTGEDLYDDDSQEEATTGKFTIQETLPNPTSTQRKLEFLLELLENNLIDLSPDYQREVVWTPDRQIGLINSLNENFYVPPVIFNIEERPAAEGSERTQLVRVCVDGKQRLSSVLRFVQGLIPCVDGDGYRWWWNRVGGRNRNLLDEEFKNRFLGKQLICIEYTNLSDLQQEDLFGRVQKGMILTEAEKLKAQKGPWQDLALDCEEDFKNIIALSQNRRASGFRNLLTVMAQIMELRTVDTKMDRRAADTPALQASAPSLKKFVKVEKDKCTATTINLIAWIFQLWEKIRQKNPEIFQNNNYKAAKNFAPIEFLAVGVMLFKYGNYRTLTMLRGDITALRLWLRERNFDLRTNPKCWRDCWEFIEHLEGLRGESGTWTDHSINPVLKDDGAPNRPANRTGASAPRKRGSGKEPREPDAILARAEQKLGSASQSITPRKIVNLKVKVRPPGTGTGTAKPEDPTPPIGGKERGLETCNIASVSLPNAPRAVSRISKTKSSLPHHPLPVKWPPSRIVQRSPSSSSAGSSNDSDDESSHLTHLHQAHQASMIISSGSASTTTPTTKRKRLSVKTADGASQLLSKRKKRALSD